VLVAEDTACLYGSTISLKKGYIMPETHYRFLRGRILLLLLTALFSQCVLSAQAQRQQMPGRLLANTYVDLGGLFEINTDGSNSVNLTPSTTQGALGRDTTPSVSADGKLIAFASGRNTTSRHIWVMNGDGTSAHALTFDGTLATGDPIRDTYPVISPDGTRIAFISNRYVYTFPSGFPYNGQKVAFNDVYVINVDGTGLHQVTTTEANVGSGGYGSDVLSVVWGPDNHTLALRGLRRVNGTFHAGIFFIQADGTGETNFAVLDSTGQHGALDWSADGRYITTPYGGEAQGAAPYRIFIFDLLNHSTQTILLGASNVETSGPGTIRFSPDSSQIVYLTTPDFTTDRFTFSSLDGSGVRTLDFPLGRGTWMWWQGGSAVPTPATLTLSYNVPPDLLLLYTGQPGVQVVPTLLDAQGNVIVHAVGDWNPSDSRFFTLDANGIATPIRTQDVGPLSLTAANGGITSAATKVMINLPNVQVKLDGPITSNGFNLNARFFFTNPGAGGASNVTLTSVTLDGVSTTDPLPHYIGNLSAGITTGDQVFPFPLSGKPSGTVVLLRVKGTFDWYGSFSATIRVRIP
jgi:Tol biopolymer transport system component